MEYNGDVPVALSDIKVIHSGLLDYEKSWQKQREIHEQVANGQLQNTLIFI